MGVGPFATGPSISPPPPPPPPSYLAYISRIYISHHQAAVVSMGRNCLRPGSVGGLLSARAERECDETAARRCSAFLCPNAECRVPSAECRARSLGSQIATNRRTGAEGKSRGSRLGFDWSTQRMRSTAIYFTSSDGGRGSIFNGLDSTRLTLTSDGIEKAVKKRVCSRASKGGVPSQISIHIRLLFHQSHHRERVRVSLWPRAGPQGRRRAIPRMPRSQASR